MKKYITLLALLFTLISSSQRKYTADKYFKEFAYVKSAELYEQIVKKGNESKEVLSNLADSYYFNSKTEKAEIWYKKLFALYEREGILPEYYFRLAQSLKSNGKYQESDTWLLKFRELNMNDSRGKKILEKKDYFKRYTSQEGLFITVTNLSINSASSDYGVFKINNDIYFSSTRPPKDIKKTRLYSWNRQPFYNIYKGSQVSSMNAKNKRVIDVYSYDKLEGINTAYHDASAVITKNGKTMYFTRDNFNGKKLGMGKKRTTNLKIYKATKRDSLWTDIVELPFNNDDYSVGHPVLSEDEKTMFVVSDKPGGIGQTDIYMIKLEDNGTYSDLINLGSTINTEGREMFPFMSKDNILYFSSDGHLGIGGLDIFRSQLKNGSFMEPENVGAPINSLKDDFSFFLETNNKEGYFSSNRDGGKGDDDIYSFVMYDCAETITGIAYSTKDGTVLKNVEVQLIDEEGKIIERVITDDKGSYTFLKVDCSAQFSLLGSLKYHESGTAKIETLNIEDKVIESQLFLKPLIVEDQIVINPIFFDFNKWNIRPDAEYELEKVISVMKQYPELVIKIESHTDSRGNSAYNRRLSDRRAKSSRDYILSRGIPAARIESAIGYGEDRLLNECNDANASKCTEEQHQKNRRSYFFIVKGNGKK